MDAFSKCHAIVVVNLLRDFLNKSVGPSGSVGTVGVLVGAVGSGLVSEFSNNDDS